MAKFEIEINKKSEFGVAAWLGMFVAIVIAIMMFSK